MQILRFMDKSRPSQPLVAIAALLLGLGCASRASASPITFTASGAFPEGGSLSGTLLIDTATGEVLFADLKALVIRYVTYSLPRGTGSVTIRVPRSFVLSESVEGVANYNNSGLFAILVHGSVADGNPMLSLSLNELNLIGFGGGPAVTPSGLTAIAHYSLSDSQLTADVPEPSPRSTVALAGLLGAMIEWRRRTRQVRNLSTRRRSY